MSIVTYSVDHPKTVTIIMVVLTLALGAFIPRVKVDTDPENMLSETEAVRVFHNAMKREFALHDMVVVGIVNEEDPDGVFNPASLRRIHELTQFAKELSWPDPKDPEKVVRPVVGHDLLAPSTVDDVRPKGRRELQFERLMETPPETREQARAIRDRALANPLLKGTLVSEDGQTLCLYLPLTDKHDSYRVASELKKKIATFDGDEKYYITGLPVAEDTFGVQMFIQMAISAPLAMLVIFILMWLFFRKLVLIISPMIVAMVSVVCTMGLLIGTGHTVHIMSSLVPIFIMPIAVLDSIHILSEFFDRYQVTRDRRATSLKVMEELFSPMLYTSLTSAAGFASLALTPIPPVQVFGIFVAIGIMLAWLLTVAFVPAYTMFISEKSLANFGAASHAEAPSSALTRLLHGLGGAAYRRSKVIIGLTVAITAVAIYGITRIQINDNPVKWFEPSHPIRIADRKLNEHFGGTYMAYLVLEPQEAETTVDEAREALRSRFERFAGSQKAEIEKMRVLTGKVVGEGRQLMATAATQATSPQERCDALADKVGERTEALGDEAEELRKSAKDEATGKRLAAALDLEADAWDALEDALPDDQEARSFDAAKFLDAFVRAQQHALAQKEAVLAQPASFMDQDAAAKGAASSQELFAILGGEAKRRVAAAEGVERSVWRDAEAAVEEARAASTQTFKSPEALRYVEKLQRAMTTWRAGDRAVVGKSSSVVDLVKKIHKELNGGDPAQFRIPDSSAVVAECIDQSQGGHADTADDVWHLLEPPDESQGKPGYRKANIWVQLKTGDNKDMDFVTRKVAEFLDQNPPPVPLKHRWFGLTYINVVWQDKMVSGMLQAFLGSFLIVFIMMTVLFRSPLWGILSMIPLTVTIALIYGVIGLVGKDYDMPVAVLSSLTLGLAVDFAIHFLARSRAAVAEHGTWEAASRPMFGEPARAITRNMIVIAVGFLPLLAAPLMPYKTVGFFMAGILAVSGVATLFVLSALLRLLERRLFRVAAPQSAPCNCAVCFFSSAAIVVLVALSIHQYAAVGWGTLTWMSVVAIPILALICGRLSRREACRRAERAAEEG